MSLVYRRYFTTGNVYIRTGPGVNYVTCGAVPKGEIVYVYEIVDGWAKSSYKDKEGYISMKYLVEVDKGNDGEYHKLGTVSSLTDTGITVNSSLTEFYTVTLPAGEIKMELDERYIKLERILLNQIVRDSVKKVIFNPPATIIIWSDDTKTISKCGPNDVWDPEKGFAIAMLKYYIGKSNLGWFMRKYVEPEIEKENEGINAPSILSTLESIGTSLKKWAEKQQIAEVFDVSEKTWEEAAEENE